MDGEFLDGVQSTVRTWHVGGSEWNSQQSWQKEEQAEQKGQSLSSESGQEERERGQEGPGELPVRLGDAE